MIKIILSLVLFCSVLISCNSVKTANSQKAELQGAWELNYISGPRIAFAGLYPDNKPTITFNLKEDRVSGKNSCNSYSGTLNADGSKINFKQPMMVTKMFSPGEGENVYMNTLQKIDSYSVSEDGKTLSLIIGDIVMMRFEKK
ncbi:META domain-containing protein [Flavobacterium caseinilyticum]|uniref:META domain-containing protein n=1 Tax=Flavobacterium caseinilyticum TaxID=2541732 RepID=A0A4R5AR74_9FLAO|nr:META domain-containing protein [Flavobacterium caseinilyticum]TDD74186.1 META domain-containing protein [Flavobacterium caseinilyticum]